MGKTAISVIIPTRAVKERATQLKRAIHSVRSQIGVLATPIVMVNGDRFDSDLYAWLNAQPDVRVFYSSVPDPVTARRLGVTKVEDLFFSCLDDDDEITVDGLLQRVTPMLKDETLDVVATIGYIGSVESGRLSCNGNILVPADPVEAAIKNHWLHSGGALFRRETIGAEYFISPFGGMLEWVILATRLGLERNILRLNTPTFIWHFDSTDRISESKEYLEAIPRVLDYLVTFPVEPNIRNIYRRRKAIAYHCLSERARGKQKLRKAWLWHIKSLCTSGGWKYLPYSRHLLFSKKV
jgi:hypothetical protein